MNALNPTSFSDLGLQNSHNAQPTYQHNLQLFVVLAPHLSSPSVDRLHLLCCSVCVRVCVCVCVFVFKITERVVNGFVPSFHGRLIAGYT